MHELRDSKSRLRQATNLGSRGSSLLRGLVHLDGSRRDGLRVRHNRWRCLGDGFRLTSEAHSRAKAGLHRSLAREGAQPCLLDVRVEVQVGPRVLGRPSGDLSMKPLPSPLCQPSLEGLSCDGCAGCPDCSASSRSIMWRSGGRGGGSWKAMAWRTSCHSHVPLLSARATLKSALQEARKVGVRLLERLARNLFSAV